MVIQYIKNKFLGKEEKNTRRFKKAVKILEKENVRYTDFLPVYESSSMRTKEEICNRAICVMIAAVKAEGLESDIVDQIVEQYNVSECLSIEESEFLSNDAAAEEDKAKFSWRYEAYYVLLWVLGYINKLDRPENICNVEKAVSVIHSRTKEQFLSESRLRDIEEVLDFAELTRRYHWAVRDDYINQRSPSTNIDSSVVYERHYAFDWILNPERDWDNADTST